MAAGITDKITKTFNSVNPNVARVNANRSGGVTTLSCDNLAGWPTDTKVHFSTYRLTSGGAVDSATQIDWAGIVSGNNIGTLTRLAGAVDTGSLINDIVEMNPTASWANDLANHILTQHNQDGSHKAVTTDTLVTSGNVTIGGTLTIAGSGSAGGWSPISGTISAVAYNGQKSYDLTTSADNTANITPGMRLRTTRTVSAPVQCTSLNGTTQYYVKTSPNKLTFTDDFVVSVWVKLSSYAAGSIISRFNGTSGFDFQVTSTGLVSLQGFNAGAGNYSLVTSVQSLPLNKWVHVAAQLDMSAFTATTTTSYIMIDGLDVPATVTRAGTNPTALIQAGNLEIGSRNGGTQFFAGKIAQAAIYNAKVTQANVKATVSQGLVGNETSLSSAYSFSNSVVDLNTTTPNDLSVGGGSAVATNADSPFGNQAGGTISATLDYLIVTKITASTITGVTAEGGTVPTTGGVAAASYSTDSKPFGMPTEASKWRISVKYQTRLTKASPVHTTTYNNGEQMTIPIGAWFAGYKGWFYQATTTSGFHSPKADLNTTTATVTVTSDYCAGLYGNSITEIGQEILVRQPLETTTQAIRYLNVYASFGGTTSALGFLHDLAPGEIFVDNAYL